MEQETVLELFDRYADMVYRIALSYLRSPQEAEDVVQTVFLKLLEGGMIVYPSKERAFLTKVTINHCKNLLTAVKKHSFGRGCSADTAGGSGHILCGHGVAGKV